MPFDNAPWKDPVTERIERVIACIEERGWCQEDVSDADGRVCLLGAFMHSGGSFDMVAGYKTDDPRDPGPSVRFIWYADAVTRKALRRVEHLVGDVGQWNDSLPPLAGKWAVLDMLRRAAAMEVLS
jgi:hypothetical protein